LAISVRARFITVSVIITAIGLSLFTHVIYDKAISYKHFLQKNAFRSLSEQLVSQADSDSSGLDYFRKLLRFNSKQTNQPALMFAIVSDRDQVPEFYHSSANTNQPDASLAADSLIKNLNQKRNDSEGQYEAQGKIHFWLKQAILTEDKNSYYTVAVYALSTSALKETQEFFGVPLIISGVLLLWIMVWASIILSSLVTKLQNQKQTLRDQAVDINQARDEAMQANQAKSDFLANMSHEIRTPLTAIIGFAEASLDLKQSVNERYQAINTIIHSGEHLLRIINDILDLSKIEAGKVALEIRPVRLIDVLHEVKEFVNVLAQEKALSFGINNRFPLPGIITTDQLRLKQILLNLCSNAVRFTDKGHVFINVSYQCATGYLQFDVVDSGIGLTEQQQAVIFNPFQQADSSTTRKYGGSGLGLTLSNQLTMLLGGELAVESVPNQGSRFSVRIKIGNVDEKDYIYEADYDAGYDKNISTVSHCPAVKGRILLAEDNKDIQALVKMLVKKTGADLVVVENGKRAVEVASESHFDLVFLDIQMPVMGGFEALQALQRKAYDKPVVAMTANAMQKDKEQCMAAGFSGFVSKPIDQAHLYAIISRYLEASAARDEKGAAITSSLLVQEPEFIDVVNAFIRRLPEIQQAINQAYSKADWQVFSEQIHQLKGLGGGFGYPLLTDVSKEIECLLAEKDYQGVEESLKKLNALCAQVIAGQEENYTVIK